ncbi:MAG TPA: aspartate--ammonia ligase [Candidatus Gracilibacteria bacterium]|nr:aspartate--ammonia ligase [Candidatus Gracilibacteria bacterium]
MTTFTYQSKLTLLETERGIQILKTFFEKELSSQLSLQRVSAPKFLKVGTGLQDDLAGTQIPVSFKPKMIDDTLEVVHSLAKWKRMALKRYGFAPGQGLYTDMDAIRKDEDLDEIHSLYVDQWDWEAIITGDQRQLDFLQATVKKIYAAIYKTAQELERIFPLLTMRLPTQIQFMHSEDLAKLYPTLSPKERESAIAREYGAVFLIGIGHPLDSGVAHDLRAADYDDWSTETKAGYHGLNGDILVWDDLRGEVLELSSMGIRVDEKSLIRQLDLLGLSDRAELEFHRGVIHAELPLSIGGGIGQSRLSMFLLHKKHIGEVQVSTWPLKVWQECEKDGIQLL